MSLLGCRVRRYQIDGGESVQVNGLWPERAAKTFCAQLNVQAHAEGWRWRWEYSCPGIHDWYASAPPLVAA